MKQTKKSISFTIAAIKTSADIKRALPFLESFSPAQTN